MDSNAPPDSPDSPEKTAELREAREVDSKMAKGDLVTDMKNSQSWVSVAQDKKSLKKYDVQISTKDGLHTVEIPDDALTSTTPRIMYILRRRAHFIHLISLYRSTSARPCNTRLLLSRERRATNRKIPN
ncbi:hypothetical protein F2Q70_00003744 [Brassica cretica]|uniref:Uncharacterized protein n=1 Tax=Brassica cretica TaxID=69181 RepID=A0A8S9IN91_BRACR|nr:hypothetical protein F2Q70_00003744 [Brassica cretica]